MDSPVGYLLVSGAVVVAALLLLVLRRRTIAGSRRPRADGSPLDVGFPGLAEFATAHGWSGPRADIHLDRDEARTIGRLVRPDGVRHVSLAYACTGHYRGMSVLSGTAAVTVDGPDAIDVGVVVVTLPYLLPKRHSVHSAVAVAAAIARRDDWAIEFSSGRLICLRREPFGSVADLARTLDGLADVVSAVPADVVARFTVVVPRLPDGRLSDPHDAVSVNDALERMTPAQRAAFLDQMRGLRRSKPR